MNVSEISTLLSEKRYDQVEVVVKDALLEPEANAELLLAAFRGLARLSAQKGRLQSLASLADATLKGADAPLERARLRWTLLKEATKAGATPSAAEGFHRLFEEVLGAAYPDSPSLSALLGRFKFREAKEPAEGLARMERAEKWIPFETGRVFFMPGRGAGRIVETNFALDAVRIDFETAKGISIPIGSASRSLVPLPEGHFLHRKLTDFDALQAETRESPAEAVRQLLASFGKNLSLQELKEGLAGLVPEERWTSFWAAARKHPQVVVHGSGKSATIEWSQSAEAADEVFYSKFEKAHGPDGRLDFYRKNAKRDAALSERMAARLSDEANALRAGGDEARALEIAVALEKAPGARLAFRPEELIPEQPLPLLARLKDRIARERVLESVLQARGAEGARVLADWFLKEEDGRTLDLIDRRLKESHPELRESTFERLLRTPRSGPRAFVWFAQRAVDDDEFRARLSAAVLGRLLDALSWDELGAARNKLRECFDRTGLAASWLVKQATLEDAQHFLQALQRHNELEPHRRAALMGAAEMRFPELRKKVDESFFVTPDSLEAKRHELEHIMKVEIPENTKGIALAAAEGDLSENFEYKARRDKQQLLSVRAGQLQEQLAKARVLDPAAIDTSEVRPGTRVTLATSSGPKAVTLLGPWDSRPEEGIYSYLADVAKAILGRKPGESVVWMGELATVEKIETWKA